MPTIAWAVDLDMVLAPTRGLAQGGQTVVMDLYLFNRTDAVLTHDLPLSLPCQIDTGHTMVTVDADLVDREVKSRVEIPGQGFAKRQYTITLPIYAVGSVRIVPQMLDMNPLTISVEKAPPEAWVGQQVPLDEGPTMLQSFIADFSVYKPTYFLLGVDPGLNRSKFQFSFKYRLFNTQGYMAQKASWLSGFHLAYTQRSIWDLKNDSKPFDDTSYMPEIFYLLPKIDLHVDRIIAFGLRSGFQHESNGKGGTDSRSTNYLYIKPIMGIHLTGPYHMKIAPKIYAYVYNEDENNGNLDDFRGYFELEIGIFDPEGIALNSHLWWASEGPTVQLDLTYPMTRLLRRSLNFYLQAQYFSGYAETLIDFDKREETFRLGFAIVR